MARPRYPSDEARVKTRPHIKVHLRAKTHRRTAEVFADPEQRGILVGLWMLAGEAYAGKTGNVVVLDRSAVIWLTGRNQYPSAERVLRKLCASVEYPVREHGRCLEVEVRKFEQKQGFDSARRGVATPPPLPSDSDSDSDSDTEEEETRLAESKEPAFGGEFFAKLAAPEGNPWGVPLDPGRVESWFRWKWHTKIQARGYKPRGIKRAVLAWWMREREYARGKTIDQVLGEAELWCRNVDWSKRSSESLAPTQGVLVPLVSDDDADGLRFETLEVGAS